MKLSLLSAKKTESGDTIRIQMVREPYSCGSQRSTTGGLISLARSQESTRTTRAATSDWKTGKRFESGLAALKWSIRKNTYAVTLRCAISAVFFVMRERDSATFLKLRLLKAM